MATKVNVNWASVAFGTIAITRVTSMSVGQGGQLIKFKGDTDLFPTVIVSPTIEPHASITSGDVGTVMAFVPGSVGTVTGTLLDAKAVTAGNVQFTLSNATFENADASGQHAQFATVTATWQLYSTDGVTNPYAVTG